MLRSAWCLMLPLFLGCAGKNTVAGADETKPEQLAASLPSWCDKTCQKLDDCALSTPCDCGGSDVCDCPGANPKCGSDCQETLLPYTKGDDACAAAGQRLKACIDALSCADLANSNGDPCKQPREDVELCPDADDHPPSGGDPTGTGGTTSYAGSASDAFGGAPAMGTGAQTSGGSTSGGTGTAGYGAGGTGPAVTCAASSASGGAGSGGTPSALTCDEGRADCSDGHEYSWLCARSADDKLGCACFLDKAVVGAFDPDSETCPELARVNAGCGFALVQ